MDPGGREVAVEVKYRITDAKAVFDALRLRGVVFSAPVEQDDQAYAIRDWTYGQHRTGLAFARLRTQNGRHLFCVQRPVDIEFACVEHETEVAEREQMHAAILAMGFYPTVRIVKTRCAGLLGTMLFRLDEVRHLGSFLEIETMVGDDRPGVAVRDELDGFARSLGVKLERCIDSYEALVRAARMIAS